MTKQELMENYTTEQLADKIIKLETTIDDKLGGWSRHGISYNELFGMQDKIEELQTEVEKYRKAFDDAKKERDCQIAEYQKKIEELTAKNKSGYVSLQQDPIDVASDLIKAFCWQGKEYLPLECMQLRQIAEYLLVYCNNQKENVNE